MADPDQNGVTWLISGRDFQVHGFYQIGDEYSSALCTHSVPSDRLTDPGTIGAKRCVACLMVLGGDLAERGQDPGEQVRWDG